MVTDLGQTLSNTFPVRTDVDPGYIQSALTKDITTLECIYDLIDNSIDAVRNQLLSAEGVSFDRYSLPASYAGFSIRLHFGPRQICIADDAFGIDEDTLANRALRPGSQSAHRYGIGRFGIGLKRALIKLGHKYSIRTDTGREAAELDFHRDEVGGGRDLAAQRVPSRGVGKTIIRIQDLDSDVSYEVTSPSWKETVVKEVSRRYGLFIEKGLRVVINGNVVPKFGPKIRKNGPVPHLSKTERHGNVRIYIDSGMHEGYRLTNEDDHDLATNRSLTDEYGWYFVCNDRIVEVATKEKKLGWSGVWHQEYYGFVGWVHFIGEEPEGAGELPWDTKKTSINPHAPPFLKIAGGLQEFADRYKTDNKASRPDTKRERTPGKGEREKKKNKNRENPKSDPKDHNENWSTLFPNIKVSADNEKLKALALEGSVLETHYPYAATALLRTTLEIAIVHYIKKSKKYKSVKYSIFKEQEMAGRPFTEDQKRSFVPSLSQVVQWALAEKDVFPDEHRRDCVTALQKFKSHLPSVQKVIHENALTDSGKVKTVRNDCWPLLRFILRDFEGEDPLPN